MKSLLTPGIWLLAAAVLLSAGLLPLTPTAVHLLYDGALIAALLLALRFHSSRIFFGLFVVFLAGSAISFFSAGHGTATGPGKMALDSIGILLPFNFAIFSLWTERGFALPSIVPGSLLLFVESVVVAVLCRPEARVLQRPLHHAEASALPFGVLLAFAAAALALLARSLLFRRPIDSAFLWALAACLLALHSGGTGRVPTAYFTAAILIMGVSIVETSYLLAYHDELTTLPSRRAFNDALLRLDPPFSIAMVDIDHFKRVNDTYGHEIGDQILRLVASRLARVTGGGQAYRCGGEEFAVLFPGKTTRETVDHLEQLRAAVEASSFHLRGADRREVPRGADRRNVPAARGRVQKGRTIRTLSRAANPQHVSVTVSIGVASPADRTFSTREKVVRAADQALYRAKVAGRNRVEVAAPVRKPARSKTAGIA